MTRENRPELRGEILVEVIRDEMVESVHHGHLLILDQAGKVIKSIGESNLLIYPRSAIKGIQSAAMVRAGLKLDAKELALVSASHAGSDRHLESAEKILASVGLDESSLKNTPDRPLGTKERRGWGDKAPSSLAANCSGKHAGMVATSKINGWDIESYKEPDHPLQLLIRAELEKLSGERIEKISVDGCGAPLFAISLQGLATSIHNLVNSNDPIYDSIFQACRSFPEMVSGDGRIITESMRQIPNLFAKDGAEGVMIAAIRGKGTIVWKMSDGSQRGDWPLLAASLSHLGARLHFDQVPVYGDGRVVGEIRASKLASDVSR
ncbi:MAG: asparaginase [Candidatus Nanopelagicaceae bacterium]